MNLYLPDSSDPRMADFKPLPEGLRPVSRPRRLRTTPAMRRMVAEMLPVFVKEGIDSPVEITSLPGQYQHSIESIKELATKAAEAGIGGIDLFGIPEHKDEIGSHAWDPNGILNAGISAVREAVGDDLVICADTCLDEFTDHGHCGALTPDGRVDNDSTLPLYAAMAVSQARRSAHGVPVGNDGRPDRRHPRRPGPRGVHRRVDHGLLGQVRICLLRALPRRRGLLPPG